MKYLRFQYWRWRGRRACRARERLFDRYDCGHNMIDQLTGGQSTALRDEIGYCVEKAKSVYNVGRRHTD